jgi:ubiquinone/menaquinone biosynthesis C-methylase UbiE
MTRDLRYWDRFSGRPYDVLEKITPQAKYASLIGRALDLRPGDRVLDLGCGTGMNLAALREAVGPEGRVHAVDYSPRMVAKARARVARHGWDNVEVVPGDATALDLAPDFDGVLASFSLSATQDVVAAVATAHRALRPGGRLFAPDMRLVPRGPGAPLIRSLGLLYRLVANWTGVDVLDAVRARFGDAHLVNGDGEPVDRLPAAAPVVMIVAEKRAA